MMTNAISFYDKVAPYYPAIFKLQHPEETTRDECDFIEKLFSKHRIKPKTVVDLGCGIGRITCELNKRKYDSIGVDGSQGMLKAARKNCPAKFVKSKIENANIKADAAISWWTTYNYLDRSQMSKMASNLCKNVGFLILDSSNYESDARPEVSADKSDGKIKIEQRRKWRRQGNKRFINMEYIIRNGKKKRIRYTDVSYWYSPKELRSIFKDKFTLIGIYGDYRLTGYSKKSKRLVTVWKSKE